MIDPLGSGKLPPGAEDKLREFFGPGRRLGRVAELPLKRLVHDYCDKFIALDTDGEPVAFVVVSPRSHPDIVADAAARARAAQAALGERLGANVLAPFFVGAPDGRSYSIAAYCRPLSSRRVIGRWQRWRLAPKALRWVDEAAAATMRPVAEADLEALIVTPLRAIERDPKVDASIRAAASASLDDLHQGRWRPCTVMSHNDLWWGNFVRGDAARHPAAPFFVVDWGGATARGMPFYDTVRLSMSLDLTSRQRRAALQRHAAVLGGRASDAIGYVLAALGTFSLDRGEWREDQFLTGMRSCFLYTSDALGAR